MFAERRSDQETIIMEVAILSAFPLESLPVLRQNNVSVSHLAESAEPCTVYTDHVISRISCIECKQSKPNTLM